MRSTRAIAVGIAGLVGLGVPALDGVREGAAAALPGRGLDPGVPQVTPSAEGSDSSRPEQEYMRLYGLDEASARTLVDRDAFVSDWANAHRQDERFVASAGGGWLDVENGLTYYFATSSPAIQSVLKAESLPDWFVVVLTARSFADLERVSLAIQEGTRSVIATGRDTNGREIPGAADISMDSWSAMIDAKSNSVIVDLPSSDAAFSGVVRTVIAAMSESDQSAITLNVVEGKGSGNQTLDACSGADACGVPLRGGIFLAQDPYPYWTCTAGFIFRNPTTGTQYASTAGHCGNSYWRHSGVGIGWQAFTRTDASVDVQFINIDNNAAWKSTNAVWKPHAEQWTISGIRFQSTTWQGSLVCHTGAGMKYFLGIDESCGTITSASASYAGWNQMGRVGGIWQCSGDSGGPYEYGHIAYGLARGRVAPLGANCSIGDHVEDDGSTSRVLFTWAANASGTSGGFDVGVRIY